MTHGINDNQPVAHGARTMPPDPFGQAALLLAESILHGMVARSLISVADAIEMVEVASDVKREIAVDLGDGAIERDRSLALLDSIGQSLQHDLPQKS